jgi:tetratricopeptide (TPR) repeat protein
VEASFHSDGPLQSEDRPFSFKLSPQEAEDIRWYLEEYPIYPTDPQPTIARRIENRMAEIGCNLFRQVLVGGDAWASARRNLSDTRIEIETAVADALVPWELMRDPAADLPLALNVSSFVRCHPRPALQPNPPEPAAGKVRILLAICRPGGADDVPFRSVARHLIRGLSQATREPFHLEVLRPPTFQQLSKRLLEAKAQGEPFHAVHFDGHGLAGEIFFENPKLEQNAQPIKAEELGKLLHDTNVPFLILNACRSAYSEPPERPSDPADLHQQIREFGSFAHAVMDYGATGVVAWRYSVFVDTAAQYMATLYGELASGLALGEAATLARKQLNAVESLIEDWTVPVVFEAVPARLFPKADTALRIILTPPVSGPESGLPQAPDIGFIGRDETVLKLDRTFDDQNIILLHAYAGSGKTSTAGEFVRWYRQTGGLQGRVLITSFEQRKTLPEVLDGLGGLFEKDLANNDIHWLTFDDSQRREMALLLLRTFQVFWIWDNVEPIAGFPAGTPSAWSTKEQNELADFLRAARETKAKFLLTSRRDERRWLHDLPARMELPPMPFDERIEMTGALARKLIWRFDDVDDWRPLLSFTQGNPLTLTVLVGQALRDGLKTRDQIADFVRKLQVGEAVFQDEASEVRERSLAASLEYGFSNAFTEAERKQLALLHLFQGFVNVDALRYMGLPESEWCLPEVKGLTREAGIPLLDRAAEIGLLTALGDGYYTIHPALPWFFRRHFDQYCSDTRAATTRAFVLAMGWFGNSYHDQYVDGNRGVIGALTAEEANLLHARSLARSNGWWRSLISAMQGLHQLYDHTGRSVEWARLVEETTPDFIDPETEGPLPGKEGEWSIVTGYRVQLAREARNFGKAERLQLGHVNRSRRLASRILAKPQQAWDNAEKNAVRNLAVSLQHLSDIQRERGQQTCVDGYREALFLAERVSDLPLAAICAFNLGHAYKDLKEIRNLDVANEWYERSLDLHAREDRIGRARCFGQLGGVACERFLDALEEDRPVEENESLLSKAAEYYQQALSLIPANALGDLATAHNQLGLVFNHAGHLEPGLHHYRESIRYYEVMQSHFGAAQTRRNAAIALAQVGRFADARAWAQAALRDYQACENADQEITRCLKLLEQIESDLPATSRPLSEHPPPH